MNGDPWTGKTFSAPKDRCRRLTEAVLQCVDPHCPLRILDLGCGAGEQLFDLASALPDASLTGIDISCANIQAAKEKCKRSPFSKRLNFKTMDYLAFQTPPFDLILSDSTLQNISASADDLFSKIAADLVPGGILLVTMPYACFYNRMLWTLRRLFRSLRSPLTDAIILGTGKLLHGRNYDKTLLQERVHYMYLLPEHHAGEAFYRLLNETFHLGLIEERSLPHVSIAQPKHRMVMFQKPESSKLD